MADSKISQLTSATLPLAGTEVLPIVQSSSTKKVATDDLTVKNVRSNATTGILQIAGPAAAATRTMTVPDANFTAARTDATQSFTGDQTLSTGNLIIGTSGKGIDFSATTQPATGMTSELLADYEEGTWTPTIGDSDGVSFTMTAQNGTYTKIGRMIIVQFYIAYSGKGSASGGYYAHIRGWPFASFYTGNKTGTNVAVFQPSLEISATAGRLSLYPSGDASNGVYTLLNGAGPQLVSFYPASGSLQGTMIGFA